MNTLHALRSALVAICLSLAGLACREELPEAGAPVTGADFVAASARYHDPAGRWPAFAARINVLSTLPGGGTYVNDVLLDRARGDFARTFPASDFTYTQRVTADTACAYAWSGRARTAEDSLRYPLATADCTAAHFRRDYYDFLAGLPMSALGPNASAEESVGDTTLFGEDLKVVRVTFREGSVAPTWQLYVRPGDARLLAASFALDGGEGDLLHYPTLVDFDGFRVKAVQTWYSLDGTRELVSDTLAFAAPY